MSDNREPGAETGGFDPDEWFRQQFGGPAASPPDPDAPAPPTVPPPVVEPVATQPIEEPPTPPIEAPTVALSAPEDSGALDELFGEEKFQEFDGALIPPPPPRSGEPTAQGGEKPPRAPLTKNQRILLWVAGGLVAALALVGLFVVGTRIPELLGPAPGAEPSPTPTPTPTPTATERPIGPVAPGEYWWDELWGGECLEPFVDAWQDEYTVVDCASPHGGQLVTRALFPLPEGATEHGAYPGEEALAAQISLLCSAPTVIDFTAAGEFVDLQIQGAFAVTAQQWNDGMQDYFCFVSRSSGDPLTRSVAVPPAP